MERAGRRLFDEWMASWADLVRFEVHEVMTSAEAAERASENPLRQRGSQTS